ncbi:hypothetical protein ACS0TY_031246 [Phlomoides rotata]
MRRQTANKTQKTRHKRLEIHRLRSVDSGDPPSMASSADSSDCSIWDEGFGAAPAQRAQQPHPSAQIQISPPPRRRSRVPLALLIDVKISQTIFQTKMRIFGGIGSVQIDLHKLFNHVSSVPKPFKVRRRIFFLSCWAKRFDFLNDK